MMKLYIRNVWVTKELVDLYRSNPLIVIWDALVGQTFKHFKFHQNKYRVFFPNSTTKHQFEFYMCIIWQKQLVTFNR